MDPKISSAITAAMSKRPLPSEMKAQQLQRRAQRYRRMAARAATEEVRAAMIALAMRYEKQAAEREPEK
jgi:hypothetical protein